MPDDLAAIASRKSAREAGACESLLSRLRTPSKLTQLSPKASSQAVKAHKHTNRLTHRHRLRHRQRQRRRHTQTHTPCHHGRDTWGSRKLSAEPPIKTYYSKPTDDVAGFLRVIGCDVRGPRCLLVKPTEGVHYRPHSGSFIIPTLMGRHGEARALFLPVPDIWHHTHMSVPNV